uniref:Uncharacterized protein n=1 Tax=Panagrolaimus sp. ES5 TaxID=591445 RepID=A0AC34GNR6_9BILA
MIACLFEKLKTDKIEEFQNEFPQANVIAAVTITSKAETSAAPSPIPPVVIQTVDLPDFGNNVAIADDLTSNFDESMSMISDDDSALFDAAAAQIDDIFPEVAEEATEIDEVQITKRQQKLLEKNVNALSATLSNFNVIVSTNNGKSNITGYSLGINVAEELNVPLKNIFDKHRAPSTLMADKVATVTTSSTLLQNDPRDRGYKEAQLQFKVSAEGVGEDKYAHVIAKIRELNLSLDEQVVSYLGPFVRDDNQEEDPLFLELNIEDSKIQIVNPKRKNPLRIHLGDIKIEDGEERKL